MSRKYEVPGSVVEHRFTTASTVHSWKAADEALESASARVRRALDGWPIWEGAKIHVVVTVERPL